MTTTRYDSTKIAFPAPGALRGARAQLVGAAFVGELTATSMCGYRAGSTRLARRVGDP